MKNQLFFTVFISLLVMNVSMAQDDPLALLNEEEDYQLEILRVTHILDDPRILDSLVSRVHANSGLLKAFDQEIQMYEEEALQKKRNWVNTFRFGVNVFSANTNVSTNNESVTTLGVLPNVGLTLTVDPEKLVNRRSYIRQAENKKQYSYYMKMDHRQRLKNEVITMYYDYLQLLESIVILQHGLETRRQHAMVMEVEFKNGNATFDQLLVVQNQVHLAEDELMKAHISAMKQKSRIEVLLGLK
jgi:outer membrane protein TolC